MLLLSVLLNTVAHGDVLSADCADWYQPRTHSTAELECGWVRLPRRADGEGDATVRLAFVRVTPTRTGGPPVLLTQGGPAAPHVAWLDLQDPVVAHLLDLGRPVVLLDSRGSGWSSPRLECQPVSQLILASMQRPADLPTHLRYHDHVEDCMDKHAAEGPWAFRWERIVDDHVHARKALGIGHYDVVGVSAGATLALDLATRDSLAVRRVVVSGVPMADRPRYTLAHALDRVAADCLADPRCTARYPDPQAVIDQGLARLDALPVDAPAPQGGLPRSPGGAEVAVHVGMYWTAEASTVLDRLQAAAHEPEALGSWWSNDLRWYWDESPHLAAVIQSCTRWGEAREPPREERPLLARVTEPLPPHDELCTSLGLERPTPPDWGRIQAPVLGLHGSWDPATPPEFSADALEQLADYQGFVLPGRGHDAIDDPCALRVMDSFLQQDDPHLLDVDCLADVRPEFRAVPLPERLVLAKRAGWLATPGLWILGTSWGLGLLASLGAIALPAARPLTRLPAVVGALAHVCALAGVGLLLTSSLLPLGTALILLGALVAAPMGLVTTASGRPSWRVLLPVLATLAGLTWALWLLAADLVG